MCPLKRVKSSSKAVNRSFFSFLARSRTRSSPGNTLPRLGVRCVRVLPVFPLAPALRSTDSASDRPELFAIKNHALEDAVGEDLQGGGRQPVLVDLTRFSGHITVTQRGVQNVEERQ